MANLKVTLLLLGVTQGLQLTPSNHPMQLSQSQNKQLHQLEMQYNIMAQSSSSLENKKGVGYEDLKRWEEKQKKIKEQMEIIKNGGKISKKEQNTREHQDKLLTVHLVPHSHDDLGWVKTMDEYYSGGQMGTQHASVGSILDSVVHELSKDKKRRFCYAESGFLEIWYNNQDAETKALTKRLIKDGQLEIVNGGWSASDEANPDYKDILNNFMIGHEWLAKEFGVTPRIGWNIDDFGHSQANTRIFAELGFEAMFFSRLDHAEKDQKTNDQAMNFLWRPDASHFGT